MMELTRTVFKSPRDQGPYLRPKGSTAGRLSSLSLIKCGSRGWTLWPLEYRMRVGCTPFAYRRVSGGGKQNVACARGLIFRLRKHMMESLACLSNSCDVYGVIHAFSRLLGEAPC